MQPIISTISYTYKKPETDVWVLNMDDIPVDKAVIKDQQIVHLAALSTGGNHKHPRREWFIGIGQLYFIWLDTEGNKHQEHMNPDGQIKLFEVPPFLPHAVNNFSSSERAVLIEFADAKMADVEKVLVSD